MKLIICILLTVSYITYGQYDDAVVDCPQCSNGCTDIGECIITEIDGPYKMGDMITCWENNDENYKGYKDKIYSDLPDKVTGEISEECLNEATKFMCDRYMDPNYPNPGEGDVCDHNGRDSCYFNTIFGTEINEEKTWSYKCWSWDEARTKDEEGNSRQGCMVTRTRISCFCQEDYCNGDEDGLISIFAAYGNPDKYLSRDFNPEGYDELCKIDFSQYEWYVEFAVDFKSDEWNAACTYDPDNPRPTGEDYDPEQETETETVEEEYEAAQAAFTRELAEQASKQSNDMVNMADIVLIFSYFIIGIACLGIGVFIGTKWKSSVMQQQMIKNQQLDV